jgi:hypothetical protein
LTNNNNCAKQIHHERKDSKLFFHAVKKTKEKLGTINFGEEDFGRENNNLP